MSGFGITAKVGQLTNSYPGPSTKNTIPDDSVIPTCIKQNLHQKILRKLKLVPTRAKIDTNLTTNNQQRRFVNE